MRTFWLFLLFVILSSSVMAQIIPVDAGSYTKTFPGTDEAGRNGFPPGNPQLSGAAVGKPVPTNDWWSKLIQDNHAANLFNYPLTMKTTSEGLVVSYIPWGVIDDQEPIVVGVDGLSASKATVADYSDWTVTMDWSSQFNATSGIGMPFIYFNKNTSANARIEINLGTATIIDEVILVKDARNGADFAIYAPLGSSWTKNGNEYTSDLAGNNYWSMTILPEGVSSPEVLALEYKDYAYVFPTNTAVAWTYDEASSSMRTELTASVEVKEGANTNLLLGLLPHHWSNLASDSPEPDKYSYSTVRGELKTMAGNSFSIENKFYGILPTLPYLSNYSDGFNVALLNEKVDLLKNDGLSTWTDSYNEGQMMNRLIQTARIADKIGNIEARDLMIATVKERLEDWLKAENSEVAFLFYYNQPWSALLGYPAGHGQDTNINDHHFHWGYFIHAASFMEQYEPGWAAQWGGMINELVRDAATSDRSDSSYPFLRNFSPYAGHCWANGFASFPNGNDQESTSESMQFNSALIHWGSVTGNDEIRDLGIYLYTTEQSAVEEYWFDMHERNFKPSQPYSLVSRVWGNSYDNGTFWTNDIEASYGIELYPIHGGSTYLGHNTAYAAKLWAEIENNTGILNNDNNVNLWHDTMWKYLAFTDPAKAINLYNSYPDRNLKFGVSDAQTYYWLHSMNTIGKVDATITADLPTATVFNNDGVKTYVAHNYSNSDITVNYSDGATLEVMARSMATNFDVEVQASLASSFSSTYPGGSVVLDVTIDSGSPTKVEFFKNGESLGEAVAGPYTMIAEDLSFGIHSFYAKVYEGSAFNVTNIIKVQSGSQSPYSGNRIIIPGTIEAGHYDIFQGAKGQGIAYVDSSPGNNGDFRASEDVDAVASGSEGATVGWIAAGEWVEYSIATDNSGLYDLAFRYASGNQSGGGPFHLELNGERISADIPLSYTGDWDDWNTKEIEDIAIPEGNHILRVLFDNGEFNLGKMTFSLAGPLPYGPPIANAGTNMSVKLPASMAELDGSASSDSDNDPLTFTWTQVNGPSEVQFSDITSTTPTVSNLVDGIYTINLMVSDGTYSSNDEVLIIVSETGNSSPTVSITSPADNVSFEQGSNVNIAVAASDLEGEITIVEFYDGDTKLGEDLVAPFNFLMVNPDLGTHTLTATATDEASETSVSEAINIEIVEVKECATTSNEALEGGFSIGYVGTYKTVGNDVTITFKLLDNDKTGVVAFLWQESPFSEQQLEQVSTNTFSTTVRGLTPGETISYACKFAFAGGLAVTKYIRYEVGTSCIDTGNPDNQGPQNFTAKTGSITDSSIEILVNATDESGQILYSVYHGSETLNASGGSGQEKSITVSGLIPGSDYNFTITANDPGGNNAANNPIQLDVRTRSTVLSVEETALQNIKAYPNPAETRVNIDLPDSAIKLFSIINLSGKQIDCSYERLEDKLILDVAQLENGVYIVALESMNGLNFIKFIKE